MKTKTVIDTIVSVITSLGSNDKFKGFICGTYSDGEPRSIPDAINNEILSPKQKKKIMEADSKKKKKKKKKKNKDKIKIRL